MNTHSFAAKKTSKSGTYAFGSVFFLVAAILWLFSIPVQAEEYSRLQPGDKIPSIESLDQYGSYQSLESLAAEKGLVLAFIRSVDWCPYCQNQVFNLQAYKNRFLNAGYNVAALSYDSPIVTMSFSRQYGLDLVILSDQDSEVIEQFGLLDRNYPETSEYFGVPEPALYVINPAGEVTHVFAEEGYENRPDLDIVLNTLQEGESTDKVTDINLPEKAVSKQ